MSLTKKQVENFQDIYRESFGREISYQDALEEGVKLVRLMEIVYKPIIQREMNDLKEGRTQKV